MIDLAVGCVVHLAGQACPYPTLLSALLCTQEGHQSSCTDLCVMTTDTWIALASVADWDGIIFLVCSILWAGWHAGTSEAIKGGDVVTVVTLSFQEAALGRRYSLQVGNLFELMALIMS